MNHQRKGIVTVGKVKIRLVCTEFMTIVNQFKGKWDKDSARITIELEKNLMLSRSQLKRLRVQILITRMYK